MLTTLNSPYERVRPADLPTFSERLVRMARPLADAGEICIIGRAAPWNEVSPSHHERIRRGAFSDTVRPLLIGTHRDDFTHPASLHDIAVALPLVAEDTANGLEILWTLADEPEAVDHLHNFIASGYSGLSVEMVVDASESVWDSWTYGSVREVRSARLAAVATVPVPSYQSARIGAVITSGISWTLNPFTRTLDPKGVTAIPKLIEWQRNEARNDSLIRGEKRRDEHLRARLREFGID